MILLCLSKYNQNYKNYRILNINAKNMKIFKIILSILVECIRIMIKINLFFLLR